MKVFLVVCVYNEHVRTFVMNATGQEPMAFRALFHAWSSSIKGFNPWALVDVSTLVTPRGGQAVETMEDFLKVCIRTCMCFVFSGADLFFMTSITIKRFRTRC